MRWLAVLAIVLSSCTWFDGDPPTRSCRTSNDCFRAQGETCNPTTHLCEVMVDAGAIDATVAPEVTP